MIAAIQVILLSQQLHQVKLPFVAFFFVAVHFNFDLAREQFLDDFLSFLSAIILMLLDLVADLLAEQLRQLVTVHASQLLSIELLRHAQDGRCSVSVAHKVRVVLEDANDSVGAACEDQRHSTGSIGLLVCARLYHAVDGHAVLVSAEVRILYHALELPSVSLEGSDTAVGETHEQGQTAVDEKERVGHGFGLKLQFAHLLLGFEIGHNDIVILMSRHDQRLEFVRCHAHDGRLANLEDSVKCVDLCVEQGDLTLDESACEH